MLYWTTLWRHMNVIAFRITSDPIFIQLLAQQDTKKTKKNSEALCKGESLGDRWTLLINSRFRAIVAPLSYVIITYCLFRRIISGLDVHCTYATVTAVHCVIYLSSGGKERRHRFQFRMKIRDYFFSFKSVSIFRLRATHVYNPSI